MEINGTRPYRVVGARGSAEVARMYEAHAPAIRSFCKRFLSDPDLAEDAVQQTFELALRFIDDLQKSDRSRAWVFSIARNECLRILGTPHPVELDERHADSLTPSPLDLSITADVTSQLHRAIASLPPIYREAVLLRDMEGFSYAEIASITGTPGTTVKFRIYKGRELLMGILEPVLKEWRTP